MLKKSLGQHLLTDKNILNKIIKFSFVSKKDLVLEIGTGTGLLTQKLAGQVKKIISFEIDKSFESKLAPMLAACPNLEIIYKDFLKLNLDDFFKKNKKKWKVIANLPYNIASQIIIKLLQNKKYFKDIYVTIQKEVASRICAEVNSPQYGVLTLLVKIYAECEHLFDISPGSFFPQPKVTSSFIKITPKKIKKNSFNEETLIKIIKSAFGQRRKKIINALATTGLSKEKIKEALLKAKINPGRRGEALTLDEFEELSKFPAFQKMPLPKLTRRHTQCQHRRESQEQGV